jgi:acyl-CoA thioester hydrolase
MGLAHHSHHFVWFEIGRTELMREAGLAYARVEEEGLFLPVVEARCAYLAPVRYDDRLTIHTSLEPGTGARVRFTYRIVRDEDGAVVATGSTTHAATDRRGRPRRPPAALRDPGVRR